MGKVYNAVTSHATHGEQRNTAKYPNIS